MPRPDDARRAGPWQESGPQNIAAARSATTLAPWEPTAWMREALARRQAHVDTVPDPDPASLTVVTPIGLTGAPGSREDRTCDRCRVYVPPTRPGRPVQFFTGGVWVQRTDGLLALFTFGLCRHCSDAEGITDRAGVVA